MPQQNLLIFLRQLIPHRTKLLQLLENNNTNTNTDTDTESFAKLADLPISVRDYGAVGDGVTDDTSAIQQALDAAGTLLDTNQNLGISGRSIVFIEGGTYKISSTLTVRNGTTLIGETKAPPYPNRLSGFKSNNNLFTGTEIVCTEDFVGEEAILLEPDNTNVENIILDGHAIPAGTVWSQINVTTAQGKWLSTAFIKFPIQDPDDDRIQAFHVDNVEIPYFQVGEYQEFQLQGIGGTGNYSFALASGSLPNGLSLSSSGLISGIATELSETFPNITISDGDNSFTRTFTMGTVLDEIETRDILPPTVGVSYSFQLESRYNAAVTWKAIGLPEWLTLSAAGELTNNRTTTTDDFEHFEFKAEIYLGADLLDKRAYKLDLRYADGAVRIFGEQTLKPEQGESFAYQYLAHGGYGDVTWSINAARSAIAGNATPVTATSPITGLTLNTSTGEVTGSATVTGRNQYYLRATSNIDSTLFFEGLFYIEAVAAGLTPKILSRSFKTGVKGQPYSFQFNVEDIPAAKPYTYEAINLPTGLEIDSSGLIAGTPGGANFVNGVRIQWSDSVKDSTIRGFRSGAGIYSNGGPSNVHRISGCLISVCDSGIQNLSQMWDSHFSDLFIFNCRVGFNLGRGSAGLTVSDTRIEYIHEDGIQMKTSNENDFSSCYFDTCGWSAIRAEDCRNTVVVGSRFYRSGRNIRGIGTRLNPQGNPEYSNHIWLKDCKRNTFTGNSFDVGTKDGGDLIYLSDHFADNMRPSFGFRIHNTPELTIVGNNLTGCVGDAISANLSNFGENNYSGANIAHNAQSDRELKAIELVTAEFYLPNQCFQVWQRDIAFNIPPSNDGNPTTFPIADGWFVNRGGNTAIDQNILISQGEDNDVPGKTFLHIEKPVNTTGSTFQTLELFNYFGGKLKDTSDRSIVLSYYAKSASNTQLGVKVSQYPDSPDNGFAAIQHQDNNRTLTSKWTRYQHYFKLADLTGINFGDNAIFNLIFRCDVGDEAVDLDITGVQIDFAPFAQELRVGDFEEELSFAQLRYQKSKVYSDFFPSWANEYRYDVNGANWNPGFINRQAISSGGHSLLASVEFRDRVIASPAATEFLSVLNPQELTQRTSANKFTWNGDGSPATFIESATERGFSVSARGGTTTVNGSYSTHWLYSAYSEDKQINGGGYVVPVSP